MRRIQRFAEVILIFILFFTAVKIIPAEAAAEESLTDTVYGVYTSQEGVEWISYSIQWDAKGLEQLNQALLRNTYGEEIYKLEEIVIYPGGISDEKGVMGTYGTNSISIAGGDFRDLQDISGTLAHEYGHHFTQYYLQKRQSALKFTDAWSEWAKVRNLELYPVDWSFMFRGPYEWQPIELIVNDYIMFYASPEVRLGAFDSDPERGFELMLYYEPYNKDVSYGDAVPGLRDYWEKITGIKTVSTRLAVPKLHSVEIEELHTTSWYDNSDITHYNYTFYFSGLNTGTTYALHNFVFFCPVDEKCDENKLFTVSPDELDENGLYKFQLSSYEFYTSTLIMYAFDPVSGNYAESLKYHFQIDDAGNLNAVPFNMTGNPDPIKHALYDPKEFKKISVFINNILQFYVNQPQLINGSTFVPFRELMESMGAIVSWDAVNQTVRASVGDQIISFVPDLTEIVINGAAKTISPAPKLLDNVTYVPIRFLAEALGAEVSWQGKLNSVYMEL